MATVFDAEWETVDAPTESTHSQLGRLSLQVAMVETLRGCMWQSQEMWKGILTAFANLGVETGLGAAVGYFVQKKLNAMLPRPPQAMRAMAWLQHSTMVDLDDLVRAAWQEANDQRAPKGPIQWPISIEMALHLFRRQAQK